MTTDKEASITTTSHNQGQSGSNRGNRIGVLITVLIYRSCGVIYYVDSGKLCVEENMHHH